MKKSVQLHLLYGKILHGGATSSCGGGHQRSDNMLRNRNLVLDPIEINNPH